MASCNQGDAVAYRTWRANRIAVLMNGSDLSAVLNQRLQDFLDDGKRVEWSHLAGPTSLLQKKHREIRYGRYPLGTAEGGSL